MPLPAGAATDAKLETIRTLLAGVLSVNAQALPLPTGAASEAKAEAIRALLAGTVAVSAASLPLPAGAATDAKLETIRALLAGTLGISAASLPLPAGAATDAKSEAIRALLAGTLAVSAASLPLPSGAATDAKVEAVRALLAGTLAVQTAYAAPASWNGASFDGRAYSGLEFQVIGTPSTAYTPQRSLDGSTWASVTVFDQNGASVTSITAAGLYTIKGRGYARLNGGAGSTLYIAGEQ